MKAINYKEFTDWLENQLNYLNNQMALDRSKGYAGMLENYRLERNAYEYILNKLADKYDSLTSSIVFETEEPKEENQ